MNKRQIIEAELRAIWDERGRLVPADVVEVAASEDHPLHSFFEWDDTEAARRFRETQAAGLIRSVKIKVTTERNGEVEDIKIRAWLPVRAAGALTETTAGYMPEEEVRLNPEMRNALLRQMQRDLQSFRRRYQHLAEFWAALAEIQPRPEEASA